MNPCRKYSSILDIGIVGVDKYKYDISLDDPDERIEAAVEHGRSEYYEAWFEYVREYD